MTHPVFYAHIFDLQLITNLYLAREILCLLYHVNRTNLNDQRTTLFSFPQVPVGRMGLWPIRHGGTLLAAHSASFPPSSFLSPLHFRLPVRWEGRLHSLSYFELGFLLFAAQGNLSDTLFQNWISVRLTPLMLSASILLSTSFTPVLLYVLKIC